MKHSLRFFSSLRKKKHTDSNDPKRRLMIFRITIFVCGAFLILRLFDLQVISSADYRAAADGEHKFFQRLIPTRGEIFLHDRKSDDAVADALGRAQGDERLFPALTNREYATVYAIPKTIKEPEKVAEQIAPLLGVEKDEILPRLMKQGDPYEVLKKKISDETVEAIKALGIQGIGFTSSPYRYFPEKGLGGHIFGYVGYHGDKERGLYGLEGYFDDILKGKEGSLRLETDAHGALIPIGERRVVDAVHGSSLVLTVDRTIQLVTCDRLNAWVGKHGADGGTVIIMDPHTGAILSMCSVPDYNPQEYAKSSLDRFDIPAIFTAYEPGSIFKPITMSIGLDLGLVDTSTTYVDKGKLIINGFTIQNSDRKVHGRQTMMEVLNESLNTGAIFVAKKIGIERFRSYVKAFGFGSLTGIELDTESAGNINALNESREIYLATSSFGQGITVTPLQMVTAFGALANGGTLMQPYIVDEIIRPDGSRKKTQPKVVRKVIKERSATLLGGMLVNVVRKGHGKHAGVGGYFVAGKTGTAQVPKKDGRGYDPHITIGSFAGFAPVDDPRFVMLVKIDRPRDVQWAESSAAPLFGELAQFLVQYLEIPPDEKIEDK
ncbi:penicillin-binding protein 2 [Candidatus Uhrbacteria bacterium]|nr:penicillin-binding protein 2 [Candidatus Uhrbacteria bacterium]